MDFETLEEKIIFEKLISGKKNILSDIDSSFVQGTQMKNDLQGTQLIEEIYNNLSSMEGTRQNYSFRNLYSGHKIIGKLIIFVKRVIRKMLYWYIEPICIQQTHFNNATTVSIEKVTRLTKMLLQSVSEQSDFELSQQNIITQLEIKQEELNLVTQNINNQLKVQEQLSISSKKLNEELIEKHNSLESYTKMYDEKLAEKQKDLEGLIKSAIEEFSKKHDDLRQMQEIKDAELIQVQNNMDKLKELDLDVFKQDGKWNTISFSQSGEDMITSIALQLMGFSIEKMTYLDLGANHAKEISNTYYFYRNGARGVLVEANPELIPELKFFRNGDCILNKCVTQTSGNIVDFYIMNGDGLSTLDIESAEECIKETSWLKIENVVKVETISVNDIINDYMGQAPVIMNLDIEGNEIEILKTIDFNKYRPAAIIVEMIPYKPKIVVREKNKEILEFMKGIDYVEYAFTGINSIFLDKKQLKEKM